MTKFSVNREFHAQEMFFYRELFQISIPSFFFCKWHNFYGLNIFMFQYLYKRKPSDLNPSTADYLAKTLPRC